MRLIARIAALLLAGTAAALAQSWPARPMTMIVWFAPAG
jgi:tripartite-type tricarboxylate transporter receptor subunit TctC